MKRLCAGVEWKVNSYLDLASFQRQHLRLDTNLKHPNRATYCFSGFCDVTMHSPMHASPHTCAKLHSFSCAADVTGSVTMTWTTSSIGKSCSTMFANPSSLAANLCNNNINSS